MAMMEHHRWSDLPEECWELIFFRLGHHSHFESLSLVCKRFLSITNRIRNTFTILDPTILVHGTLSPFFTRFRNITSISLVQFPGDLNSCLLQIAVSGLEIENLDLSNNHSLPVDGLSLLGENMMRSLRVLNCSHMGILSDKELTVIADSMPFLEELDISHPRDLLDFSHTFYLPSLDPKETRVSDVGIERLASRVTNLRKINISGHQFVTDKSIISISSNCIHLTEIKLLYCSLITHSGLHFLVNNCANLNSLSVEGNQFSHSVFPSQYLFSSSAKLLSSLHMYNLIVSDEFLFSIANAGFPLKKLTLSYCSKFTFSGLSFLLRTHHSLEYFSLISVMFLDDALMVELSKHLSCLITLKLNSCYNLTNWSLYILAKNCPFLENIDMQGAKVGKGCFEANFKKNPRIKALDLARNVDLSDECLIRLALIFPGVEKVDVSSCPRITEKGVLGLLNNCGEIRELNISDCKGVTSIGMGPVLEKLEVIRALRSEMDDVGLFMIGVRCRGLVSLNVKGCVEVTGKGLVEVSRKCLRLKEINVDRCSRVSRESVDWIVFSRPSLRKIIAPSESFVTPNQRKLFLRHGCFIG
ncbi:F-box/LRR-repeat protein 3 [Impatiens glandulifera]|uniref:F-box/LRR-repeat protein 3 n=1 Tax=Impatiens glandulifera TaxID=253017 RepID=UPI001FB0D8AB|nr:F-box/LRR-repeat protein 3 [Impatiens glandulifera]